MGSHRFAAFLALTASMLVVQPAAANLIRNGSFELTPCTTPCNQVQAVMPSEWLSPTWEPDTYSNDGSYGLPPDAYLNFVGATAQDGIRFVAGWSLYSEVLSQVLSAPLVPGTRYSLSGFLRQSTRQDLTNPGTYQIELWDSTSMDSNKVILGRFDPIANATAWEPRQLTFTAPEQASTYTVLAFRPVATGRRGEAYPGLDNVSLLPASVGTCSGLGAGSTVSLDGCDTGVPSMSGGVCLANELASCGTNHRVHGHYVNCIARLTNSWVSAGVITGLQKGSIQSCSAQRK